MNKLKILMTGASLKQNGGIATVENLILKYVPSHIQIQHITSHDEGSIAHRIIVFGKAVGRLTMALLFQNIDLVHIHLSDGGSVVRKAILTIIASIFGKPVLMHAHGAEFHSTYFKLPKWIQQKLASIFRQCKSFVVLSKAWKDFYSSSLDLNPEKVFILPNPIELPEQIPNRQNVTVVNFVFLGRVGQRKGAFDLIKAFAQLPHNLKDRSRLTLAGDGDLDQGSELVESLNLAEYVTFLGWIDGQQREKLLMSADVLVLPSYNEALPMALLEAMSWEVPVITTPVGGIAELVTSGTNGLLITPGHLQQLSEAMQLLIKDEALRLLLGSAARKTVTAFNVKTYCSYLSDVYVSSLKSNQECNAA